MIRTITALAVAAVLLPSAPAWGPAAAAPLKTPTGACAVPCNNLTPQDVVQVDYVDLDHTKPGFQRTATVDAGRTLTIWYKIVINPSRLPPGSHVVLMVVPSWTPSYPPPSGYYKVIYDGVPQQEITLEGSVLLRTPKMAGTFGIWIVYGGVGDVSRFLEVWAQTSPHAPGCSPHAEVTLRAVARVRVADMSVEPRSVRVGGEVTVRATLVNDGTAPADEDVRVYVDGSSAGTKRMHLEPDESKVVTFRLTMNEPGDHQITLLDRTQVVHVSGGPQIKVSGLLANATKVDPGEKVSVTVTVSNSGESEGEVTLKVFLDGRELQDLRKRITVQPASSIHQTWTIRLNEPGDHKIKVNNLQSVTIHVVNPGSCQLENLTLESHSVVVGSSVNATLTIGNPGETEVRCPVSLKLNGSGVGADEVEVPPGSSVNVTFRFLPPKAGVYTVSAGNLSVNLVVSPPEAVQGEGSLLPPGSEPAVLGAAAVLGGVGSLIAVRRLWRWKKSRSKATTLRRRVRSKKSKTGGRVRKKVRSKGTGRPRPSRGGEETQGGARRREGDRGRSRGTVGWI